MNISNSTADKHNQELLVDQKTAYSAKPLDTAEERIERLGLKFNNGVDPLALESNSQKDQLEVRIARAKEIASHPAKNIARIEPEMLDLEPWKHIGDPLAEALILELRQKKMMTRDIYAAARKLESEGNESARKFFEDVEFVPSWADFDRMRLGATLGLRNPLGLMFSVHGSMAMTYVTPNVARVMAFTGRLDKAGDFPRRYWETATGFVGALDVDGMKPLGPRWEIWVRIRLMHTMVRMGILSSKKWNPEWFNPIDQLTTAAGVYAFGQYRINIIRALGTKVSEAEQQSYNLMWRWVTRILGVVPELLGTNDDDQKVLDYLLYQYLYTVSPEAIALTDAMINGLSQIPLFGMSRTMHAAMVSYLLSPNHTAPSNKDIAHDLQVKVPLWAKLATPSFVVGLKLANRFPQLPGIRNISDKYALQLFDQLIKKQLGAKKADYRTNV